MQLLGEWLTKEGIKAVVNQKIPKLRAYFGFVKVKGKIIETIWNESGINAEFPEWDLQTKQKEFTHAPSTEKD